MKKNKVNNSKLPSKIEVLDYSKILGAIQGVSDLSTIEVARDDNRGEYKFRFNETEVYFSIIVSRTFTTFRLANFFDFKEHVENLKDDLDELIYNFNIRSIGYKCFKKKKEPSVVAFCSEFLFNDNVITSRNIRSNLALITAFPKNFLKVDE
ncbi:hypothetical protein [Enterobacter ludwigii]|uniref:hypothetical protein n=1 Tax=Enterobacter ludwigii TaxID=299767 RepID=UPI002A22ABBF|nr:hypothetical protein [Enterobacter ludwigii]EKS7206327.1 hypothetical protein [Enterobacter ludwigii]